MSLMTVWEVSKAMMKGYFIQYNHLENKSQENMWRIFDELKKRNWVTKAPTDSKLLHQIKLLSQQLSMLTAQKIEIKLNNEKERHIEFTNERETWLHINWEKRKDNDWKNQEDDSRLTDDNSITKPFDNFYYS